MINHLASLKCQEHKIQIKKKLKTHNNDSERNMMKKEAMVWVMVFNATYSHEFYW